MKIFLIYKNICFRVPGITIATDIICGFPTETDHDFEETLSLCKEYKFPSLFINQFYPRPGTPAAKMPRIPTQDVKKRTKKLADFFQTYQPYNNKIGEVEEILVTEVAYDNKHLVGHNEFYEQVLVPKDDKYMGQILKVRIIDTKKHCLIGVPVTSGFSPAVASSSDCSSQKTSAAVPYTLLLLVLAVFARILWLFF